MRVAVIWGIVLLLAGADATAQRGTSMTGRRDLVGRVFDARVARVADGDTIDAVPSGEQRPVRVRLEGVDAPELSEGFGRDALVFVRTLVVDRTVRITGRDLDRYGRLVARVAVNGDDVSTALIRAGLACYAYTYDPGLAREEARARAAGVGFWSPRVDKPRCTTR